MSFFVYYDDDYADNGGRGLERFENRATAEAFITKRIGADPDERSIENYKVIEGEELGFGIVEVVKKIKID